VECRECREWRRPRGNVIKALRKAGVELALGENTGGTAAGRV
jgi:hypothetical protein